jgi:hypothetical protein
MVQLLWKKSASIQQLYSYGLLPKRNDYVSIQTLVHNCFIHKSLSGQRQHSGGSWLAVLETLEALMNKQDPISTSGWMWWHGPVISATRGSTNRRLVIWVSPNL